MDVPAAAAEDAFGLPVDQSPIFHRVSPAVGSQPDAIDTAFPGGLRRGNGGANDEQKTQDACQESTTSAERFVHANQTKKGGQGANQAGPKIMLAAGAPGDADRPWPGKVRPRIKTRIDRGTSW
jgi:hypothetical protein